MQETRIYLIQDLHSLDKHHSRYSDNQFIDIAEEQGGVFSLKGFQEQFSCGQLQLNSGTDAIRLITIKN